MDLYSEGLIFGRDLGGLFSGGLMITFFLEGEVRAYYRNFTVYAEMREGDATSELTSRASATASL